MNDFNNKLVLNQYDKVNAFNYCFNEFKKECSIISDIFLVLQRRPRNVFIVKAIIP